MEKRPPSDRRQTERRWRERRCQNHPVFLDTRVPHDRRGHERREGAAVADALSAETDEGFDTTEKSFNAKETQRNAKENGGEE
jgi:hypothetical protein